MTDVIAGQPKVLLAQFYDFAGGSLTDLDATPTIAITEIATGTTALAATTSGVTHPAVGSYGYAWTPASTLTPGAYLATWSGLKSGSPVTATETVTVTAPPSAEDANTNPQGIWYATREDVMRALDVKTTARNSRQIDRALESGSRSVEDLCHRRFYPMQATRYFDWPDSQYRPSWRIWLDDNELISLTSVTSGGEALDVADVLLEPVRTGPPYSRVEVNLGSSAAWSSGDTHQRAVGLSGLWAGAPLAETTVGVLAAAVASTTATTLTVDGAASADLGVGSVLRVDSERMLVTGRSMADTGQNLGANIDQQMKTVTVPVANGAQFAVDEVILIDAERMLIVDIAGNNLIVKRAWDGSPNAEHTSGADIYAPRALTVTRGALGTTATTHADASAVVRWDPPGLARQLTIAEAVNTLNLESSGYAKTLRAGESGSGGSERNRDQKGIDALRTQVYNAHGRKGRVRSV